MFLPGKKERKNVRFALHFPQTGDQTKEGMGCTEVNKRSRRGLRINGLQRDRGIGQYPGLISCMYPAVQERSGFPPGPHHHRRAGGIPAIGIGIPRACVCIPAFDRTTCSPVLFFIECEVPVQCPPGGVPHMISLNGIKHSLFCPVTQIFR